MSHGHIPESSKNKKWPFTPTSCSTGRCSGKPLAPPPPPPSKRPIEAKDRSIEEGQGVRTRDYLSAHDQSYRRAGGCEGRPKFGFAVTLRLRSPDRGRTDPRCATKSKSSRRRGTSKTGDGTRGDGISACRRWVSGWASTSRIKADLFLAPGVDLLLRPPRRERNANPTLPSFCENDPDGRALQEHVPGERADSMRSGPCYFIRARICAALRCAAGSCERDDMWPILDRARARWEFSC